MQAFQAKFVTQGAAIDHTPAGDVGGGDVVVQDNVVGIAKTPIAGAALGALAIEGIFDVVKKNEAFATVGANLYWDAAAVPYGGTVVGAATATAVGNTWIGWVLVAADATDETVRMVLKSSVMAMHATCWPFALGLAGEDTDGAGTNGAGMAGGSPDLTTNQFADSAGTVYVKCYDKTTTTWDDLKTAALLGNWAANYQLQPDAAGPEVVGDAFAIGFDTQFCEVCFNDLASGNGALATYGADCGKWQYSTGAGTWGDLTVYDGTDLTAQDGKRPLQRAGAISFAPPADWVAATYDGQEAYWIQWAVTAVQLTQSAVIDDTAKDEPFVVIPNGDTFAAPHDANITRVRVTNMHATVHDQIIKFVVGNFTTGVFSAELSWAASQLVDSFTLAAALAVNTGDLLGICITEDTASTNNPIWAVELGETLT